jgi:hypothetical protein
VFLAVQIVVMHSSCLKHRHGSFLLCTCAVVDNYMTYLFKSIITTLMLGLQHDNEKYTREDSVLHVILY